MSEWKKVCWIEDIPLLGSRVVRGAADEDVAIFRTGENEVFAVHDRCPHRGGPLSQGIVHDKKVTCPLHGLNIDLTSGKAVAPDEGHTPCVQVRVEAGSVELRV